MSDTVSFEYEQLMAKHNHVLSEVMNNKWGEGVRHLVEWQLHYAGDFHRTLMTAFSLADEGNLCRLGQGFPDEYRAFLDWSRGDLAERLRNAGLRI